ncbi:MAG: type II secretion system F family protein [Frankiaceae bacterium]
MGLVVGLLLGLGAVLVWSALTMPSRPAPVRPSRVQQWLTELIAQAGVEAVRPAQVVASAAGLAATVFVLALAVSGTPTVSMAFAVFGAWTPFALLRWRQRQRTAELRELWPDVVDNLSSAVRAGMSLPEALAQVGVRGPEPLRPAFQRFGEDYRATGRFAESLDRLKASLADPAADRIVESVRMAREVGGTDLGRLLRTLSAFLRDDARTRAELETRQGWTVNAARLGVAAPWVMLGFLSTRPEAVRAYDTAGGALVLGAGGGVSLVAYQLMLRIARLPDERRVLR